MKAPAKYARSYLYREWDANDLTHFVPDQLDVVLRAINELQRYLRRKMHEVRDTEHLVKTTDLNHRQALQTTLSDPRHGIEGTGAQLVGGIREDQVQALPRGAVLPVPASGHQSAMQLIVGCVQHLEQRQLPEHQEEPVLERCPSVISRPRKLPDGNQSMATRTLPACG